MWYRTNIWIKVKNMFEDKCGQLHWEENDIIKLIKIFGIPSIFILLYLIIY